VAAVEFALLLTVLLLFVALVWPLGVLFLQKMQLDRAMSDVIRYATATPNSPEYDPNGTATTRRPTCAEVSNEFFRAYYGSAGGSQSGFVVTIPSCPSDLEAGQTVSVTVTKTTSLGPLGDLLSIAGITHSSSVTVSAGASGREE
jgi:Flp pilus assembly protein TadG